MKQRSFSVLALAIFSITVFSCKKSNNTIGLTIPKNVVFAFYADGKSLNSKLPWDSVKNSEMVKELLKDSTISAVTKAAVENPENTGIDINNNFIFFYNADSTGGYVAFEGILKDAAKFKSYINSSISGLTHAEKDGIHFYSKGQITASYKDTRFIIASEVPGLNKRNKYDFMTEDSTAKPEPVIKRDMQPLLTSLYSVTDKESLGTDSRFTAVTELKGDIHFWFNGEALMKSDLGAMAAITPMLNLSKLYNGNATGGAVNFEDGKISANTLSYSGKEVEDIWKKYKGTTINEDLLNRIPGKDVTGYFALNFKPKGLEALIKLMGIDGIINMGLAEAGITLDDFIKANGGDLLFAASNLKADTATGRPDANFVFSVSIGDKASFKKLIDAGKKAGGSGAASAKVAYNSNEKYFAIGNNKPYIDQFIAGGKNNVPMLDKLSGNPMGGYINLQLIIQNMQSDKYLDSLEKEQMLLAQKFWDNAIMNGGKFSNHAMEGYFEVNLMDKKTNSLKQLHQYMGAAIKLEKLREEKMKKEFGVIEDTKIEAVPPTDTTTVALPEAPKSK